ncbi:phosphoribosylanthranilate isomerase [Listeria costaricensis]|uniref:phosphoribosylanthranilate isomerase n=1 Tax=Listeria costaricensis TaxID=2026604 RepID=UPI000C075BB7|nr:phosphoribosylanthranilate isomerase [Listeria costaricensis]
MKVKICGLKTKEDAQFAALEGADFIGFVFAPSKRQVSLPEAAQMSAELPDFVQKVGVFVDPTFEEVEEAIQQVPLDYVQLHGKETPAFASRLSAPVIKAFKVKDGTIQGNPTAYPDCLILLDAPSTEYEGGGGIAFDWEKLDEKALPTERLIIAGGLSSANVGTAIRKFTPFAVDVSTGVETNGKKDPYKIKQFIKQAKERKK